jgi:tRNA threonylcarbamoyladenosine biosynthesis protein TsaB
MTILALEFSSEQRSVALARDGKVLASAVESGGIRMTNAFGLISRVLMEAAIPRAEVGVIAVGLGPGSYTGIRAAISVAQGWQLALGVKLLGVGSVEAMAARAQAEKIFGRVNMVVDAQRGEFYLATWDISAGKREELSALRIASAAEIAERARAGERCLGPAAETVLFPDAPALARLAGGRTVFASGDRLEPVYLRETSFVKAPLFKIQNPTA